MVYTYFLFFPGSVLGDCTFLKINMPFVVKWMDLEIIIVREVRERKTNFIYLLYVESKKIIQKILLTKQK